MRGMEQEQKEWVRDLAWRVRAGINHAQVGELFDNEVTGDCATDLRIAIRKLANAMLGLIEDQEGYQQDFYLSKAREVWREIDEEWEGE